MTTILILLKSKTLVLSKVSLLMAAELVCSYSDPVAFTPRVPLLTISSFHEPSRGQWWTSWAWHHFLGLVLPVPFSLFGIKVIWSRFVSGFSKNIVRPPSLSPVLPLPAPPAPSPQPCLSLFFNAHPAMSPCKMYLSWGQNF